jgi:hypothetical protein
MNGSHLPAPLFRAFSRQLRDDSPLLRCCKSPMQHRNQSSVSGRTNLQFDGLQLRRTKPLLELRQVSRKVVRVLCHADLLVITRGRLGTLTAWLAVG